MGQDFWSIGNLKKKCPLYGLHPLLAFTSVHLCWDECQTDCLEVHKGFSWLCKDQTTLLCQCILSNHSAPEPVQNSHSIIKFIIRPFWTKQFQQNLQSTTNSTGHGSNGFVMWLTVQTFSWGHKWFHLMPVNVHSMCEPPEMEKSLTFDPVLVTRETKEGWSGLVTDRIASSHPIWMAECPAHFLSVSTGPAPLHTCVLGLFCATTSWN